MAESATRAEASSRDQRRQATLVRISRRAKELAIEVGYDGFTMEQLALDCGVSRRTLFNYVKTKDEAVAGGRAEVAEAAMATYLAGGPSGRLITDLAAMVRDVMVEKNGVTPYDISLGPRVLARNPQLAQRNLDKFADYAALVRRLTAQREGLAPDALRVTLALELVVALVRTTFESYAESDGTRTLAEEFDRVLATAQALGQPDA